MTEAEWQVDIPSRMMQHIADTAPASPRKLRLLGVAFARFLELQPDYADAKHVSQLGEAVAEGYSSLEEAGQRAWAIAGDWRIAHLALSPDDRIDQAIRKGMYFSETDPQVIESGASERWQFARKYICCIIGNPFRPVAVDPNWLTSTVVDLARGVYADRAFDRLPILSDALQDAGCINEDVLTHCRGPGPHARGCWVVDLVLGKA